MLVKQSAAIQPWLFSAMVLAGISTTMVGPLLPGLQARWHIGDSSAGLLFTALFLASVATGALVGPLSLRFGHSALVRSGLVLCSLGVAMLAVSPWPHALAAVAIVGSGLGLTIPAANLGVSGARTVMLVNFAWSVGAVGGPWLLAASPDVFLWSLSAALAVAGVGRIGRLVPVAVPEADNRAVLSKATAVAALFAFLYVGVESSLDGWLSSYASRDASTRGLWAALPSIFWTGILSGRFIASLALMRLVPTLLLGACLVAALGGTCLLLVVSQPWAVLVATTLTGLGLAPVFPLVVARYSEVTRGEKSAGLIFAAGGLGGASVPALVGSASERAGGLGAAMLIPPALIVMMLILWRNSGTGQREVRGVGDPITPR